MEIFTLIIVSIFLTQSKSQLWNGVNFGFIAGWNVDTGIVPSLSVNATSPSVNCIKLFSAYTIVSGGSDNRLYVWDIRASTQNRLKAVFIGHNGSVTCCDKLLNGNVISGGSDKALFIWNPSNGSIVTSQLNAHSTKILCLKVLSNGNIATGAENSDTDIKIWSVNLGTPIMTLHGHSNNVLVIDQLSNGNLISGSTDTYTIIWDLTSGDRVNYMQPISNYLSSSTAAVKCLKQLPDGNIAFAGGSSNAIYTWNITSSGVQNLVSTSSNIIATTPCQVMILYNNSLLAVASSDSNTYLVDISNSTNLNSVKNL